MSVYDADLTALDGTPGVRVSCYEPGEGTCVALPQCTPSSSEAPITMRALLEAGVHFGHQTKRWNPKMKPFIHGKRHKIHVINLEETIRGLYRATHFLRHLGAHCHAVNLSAKDLDRERPLLLVKTHLSL